MPITITLKCSCTNGTWPKKYPKSAKTVTQATPPITLKNVNFGKFIRPRPQTNGAKVLKNGINLVITTVRPPNLSKNPFSLSIRSFVRPLTLPELIIRSPKNLAIQ